MIRKNLIGMAMALALLVAGPQQAEAETEMASFWSDYVCAEASFNPCVDFELFRDDSDSELYYLGSLGGPQGLMTAGGLYTIDGDGSPWTFMDFEIRSPTERWTWGACGQLNGGGNVLLAGCPTGDNDNGIQDGIATDGGGEVVPEPMTVILLATGLVGIGAVGHRSRRKEDEEV